MPIREALLEVAEAAEVLIHLVGLGVGAPSSGGNTPE
jgi:hypothetical protein